MTFVLGCLLGVFLGVTGSLVFSILPDESGPPENVEWSVADAEALTDQEFSVVGETRGIVMLGTDDGVYEVSPNGTALWGLEVNTGVDGCYRASEKKVAFWVKSKGFYVVDRDDGELMWSLEDEYLSSAAPLDGSTAALIGTSDGAVFEAHYDGSTDGYWSFQRASGSRERDDDRVYDVDTYDVSSVVARDDGFLATSSSFDLVVEVNNDVVEWSWGSFMVDQPRSLQVLEDGDLLLCDSGNYRVIEVDKDTGITWEAVFDTRPIGAERLWTGLIMVVDSDGCNAVNYDNDVVWTVTAGDCRSARWYYGG